MKRLFIFVCGFFQLLLNPAYSETKVNYLLVKDDTLMAIYNNHIVGLNSLNEKLGPFDFLNFSEPRSGKYNEISRTSPPFTFFDNGNITAIRNSIRSNIIFSKNNYDLLYLKIFNLLDGTNSLPACSHELICNEAYKAKAAAFVYFIGLGKQNNDLGAVGDPAREHYYDLAVNFIKGARTSSDRFNGIDRQRYRAFELIQYLQGFDYLYTTRFFSGVNNYNTFPDKDELTDILCDFTTELHSAANNLRQSYAINNNISIIISSAVGMSACIFHQRAVRFWQNQKKPERWGHAAHAYIARTLFEGPAFTSFSGAGPMSVKNEIGGYAEGQHYFAYGFQALIPFMKTYYQSIGIKSLNDESDMGGRAYWPCALCPKSVPQEPYNSKSYLNIYKWYRNILLPNQEPPTIDDTWKKDYPFTGIALIGNKENNPFTDFIKLDIGLLSVGEEGYNLYIDYLLTMNYPKESEIPEIVEFKKSGDLIVKDNVHYLHVNAETDNSNNGGYHEHGDVTSFTIGAGNMDVLAMDPPYYGESERNEVRKGKHHNVITIDDKGPNKRDDAIYSEIKKDISYSNSDPNVGGEVFNEIGVNATYWKYLLGVRVGEKITVNRRIERHNYQYQYYVVNDLVKNISMSGYANVCFNINGDGDENTTGTFEKINEKTFLWKRPCTIDNNSADNWKMYSTTYGNDGTSVAALAYDANSDPKNGTQSTSQNHTRASVCQPIPSNEERQFTTIIEVLPCNVTTQALREVRLSPKFTTYRTAPKENSIVIHLSHDVLPKLIDTVLDPLRINQNAILHTDAKFSFFHYSTNKEFKSGNCISYCNFRMARISEGSLFKYHDTTYLESTKIATVYYSLIGKCKYKAYIETDTACSVSFYLADVDTGVGMKVIGLPFTYNTLTCMMQVDVPIGLTQFEIELSDPCRVSCFFPSTAETIDEQFDFNEGITQTLGHKLSIVQPHGFLNISKGSHMMLCEGIYLHNRDSLVLFSGCGKDTGQVNITTCNGEVTGKPYGQISGFGGGAKSSKITVKIGAALILEDSSFTQISNNSELHVYGTLVIKKGAKLLIGDNRTCSYATIMVYPGAYVHIEDDAHLEFLKIIGDTHDRHIVFIANKPYGAGAQKGIASSILPLLQNDTIISSANVPVEICDLFTVTPTHGIANRDWGFCNLLAPKALIKIPNDTICEGECLLIDFKSSLNDPIREIEVCRIDSFMGTPILSCFGTWRLESNSLNAGYNESSKCYYSEAQLSYFPLCDYIDSTNSWFRLFVTVKNHCDQQDTQTVYFYVANKPNSLMAMADSACPGYGTVTAYNLSENNAEKAIWHVHLLDSTQHQENDENPFYYGGDWEQFNIHYGDSFAFPDFNWVGGFKYVVNLTQVGRCGEAVSKWDTIEIQPGAKIMASPSTVYSNPLGPSALQLQAFIGSANSFTWSPTSYLDNYNILNPIATPTDTITYFLATSNGNCAAFDTLHIKHNTLAFAGNIDSVCNAPVLLGTSFDASLFLAYQYYENPSAAWTQISARLANDSSFFDKLSLYFLSEQGKNALQSIGSYSDFLVSLNRAQFYEKSWYINYFMLYHQSHNYQDAFDFFVQELAKDASLTNYIGSNPMFHTGAMQTFLDLYEGEMINNNTVQLNAVWEKYTENGTQWESMGNWDDQIKIWDSVASPTQYKITVIDNANSLVEFDQVSIWADRPVAPMFYVQFQTDSTLYFTNVSEPVQSSNVYAWNFGDGSSSNQTNPIHTFPFFDSAYVVCLTASNLCGTYTYCDTLRVDSTGLIGYSKYTLPPMNNTPKLNNPSIERGNSYEAGIKVLAFPNPFNEELNVNYQIEISYQKGELRIQNTLGETLNKISFNGNSGQIQLSTQMLSSGLYTFQIILDGRLVQIGKLMRD